MLAQPAMTLPSGYDHAVVPTKSVKKKKSLLSLSAATNRRHRSPPPQLQISNASAHHLQEPASQPPPSVASHSERVPRPYGQLAHQMAPSESSSLASMTTDNGPPSELGLESTPSLPRRSSNESNTPSRGRPESLHTLGKSLFHRRAKSKPGHRSQNSSSTNSIESTDASSENRSRPGTQFFIPSIFSWKKPDRDEAAANKKRHISGPFNFQHVVHQRREDHIATLGSPSLSNGVQSSVSSPGHSQSGIRPDFDATTKTADASPPGLMRHVRSYDNLQTKPLPAMPPCSDHEDVPSDAISGPHQKHPPRLSSRQALQPEFRPDAAGRQPAGTGFRKPKPFNPLVCGAAEKPPSQTLASKDGPMMDGTWPMTTCHTTLSDVPEEEELLGLVGRHRLSVASNVSTLRCTQSAPLLRSAAQAQRPISGASETLGYLELALMHHVASLEMYNGNSDDLVGLGGSWEDDVDYCYEHEAEANCNYQWDRPSLDTPRDSITPPPLSLRAISPPASQQTPALSPASQTSLDISHEALAPTSEHLVSTKFALPREDGRMAAKNGMPSLPSHFQECHVSSPWAPEANPEGLEKVDQTGHSAIGALHHDDSWGHRGDQASSCYSRQSTSTTATTAASRSSSADKLYSSATSSRTTLTHRTASSTSLNKMAGTCHESTDSAAATTESRVGGRGISSQGIVPELFPLPLSLPRGPKASHKPHASQSQILDQAASRKAHDGSAARRQRARTTSVSTQAPPPVGQYSLFPRAYAHSTGQRI